MLMRHCEVLEKRREIIDAMATWNGAFRDRLDEGKIELSAETLYNTPILYVPIVRDNENCVAYAMIGEKLDFAYYEGEVVTQEFLDALWSVSLDGASGDYVFLRLRVTDRSFADYLLFGARFHRYDSMVW